MEISLPLTLEDRVSFEEVRRGGRSQSEERSTRKTWWWRLRSSDGKSSGSGRSECRAAGIRESRHDSLYSTSGALFAGFGGERTSPRTRLRSASIRSPPRSSAQCGGADSDGRAAVRLMLAAWQAIAQERPRTAIVAASLLLRVSTALVLVAAERVLPTWDAEVTTLAKAHALSTRLEAFVRWDTVHYVQIALEGYERDKQTAFLPGLPALLRCGGQLVRRLGTGEWGGFTANDAVIAGIVATAIATTAAALALHR